MANQRSRRSFIGDLFTVVAGGCVAVGGMLGLFSAFSGCDTAEKYGPAPKYGTIPYEGGVKYGADFSAPKYGALFDGGANDGGPAPKYGILLDGGKKG